MEAYTINVSLARGDDFTRINTTCTILDQQLASQGGRMLELDGDGNRQLQGRILNRLEYSMVWESVHIDVTSYPSEFEAFINGNLGQLTSDLVAKGLNVTASQDAFSILQTSMPSASPTTSVAPSYAPSLIPSVGPTDIPTFVPSNIPTDLPSIEPSDFPTAGSLSPSIGPSGVPTSFPSTTPSDISSSAPSAAGDGSVGGPTPDPGGGGGGQSTTIFAVIAVLLTAALMIGTFLFYRYRKRRKEREYQTNAAQQGRRPHGYGGQGRNPKLQVQTDDRYGGPQGENDLRQRGDMGNYNGNLHSPTKSDDMVVGILSPSESLLSNQSLLSAGGSMGGGSVDEVDNTHHLADEFDQYKDQNLEQMRSEVVSSLGNADGMMSQAMTKALMDDGDDPAVNPHELYWGGCGDATEIEATALSEVNGWLKRKGQASLEER